MDQFFENHKLLKLSQDEIDKQNSPVTTEEMDFMTLRLQEKKSRGPDGISGDFYQTVKEIKTNSMQSLLEKRSSGETSQLIL